MLTPGSNGAVMDVASGGETGSTVVFSEDHSHLSRRGVQDGARVHHPVILGRVAIKVRRVREDAREVGKSVLSS